MTAAVISAHKIHFLDLLAFTIEKHFTIEPAIEIFCGSSIYKSNDLPDRFGLGGLHGFCNHAGLFIFKMNDQAIAARERFSYRFIPAGKRKYQ